jgi:nicotinamidase-related amidase
MQSDFTDAKGSLTVYPGSKRDIENLTRSMYANMEGITDIMCSIDTHYPLQIFFSSFWQDEFGNPVNPGTMVAYADVQSGKFKSIHGSPKKVAECLKALETAGKVGVYVWPYHCLIGTPGFNLENQFAAMVHFHSHAKNSKPQVVFKGTDIYSEMYGIIHPEYNPENTVRMDILNAIASVDGSNNLKAHYDEIYIAGEAASHCVLESASQILAAFKDRPEILQRITILEDCTSPVPGFEQQATDGLENLKKAYGIKIAKSTDIQFN